MKFASPNSFCFNRSKVKAIVLGCDPTNFSDKGKPIRLNYVFGIGEDNRYFSDILSNLQLIDLHLEDVYIQNLVADYQKEETSANKEWKQIAIKSIEERKIEFDYIDKNRNIPVFLTSELLYKVLLVSDAQNHKAEEFYSMEAPLPIPASNNLLNRPLLPLYRHFRYKLNEHKSYLSYLQSFFH